MNLKSKLPGDPGSNAKHGINHIYGVYITKMLFLQFIRAVSQLSLVIASRLSPAYAAAVSCFLMIAAYQVGLAECSEMDVPTLRNVDKHPSAGFVKAYGHNGYFKSLDDVVRFYASRGMMGDGMMFPEPEVNQNLASLNMFRCRDQVYIIAFLKNGIRWLFSTLEEY